MRWKFRMPSIDKWWLFFLVSELSSLCKTEADSQSEHFCYVNKHFEESHTFSRHLDRLYLTFLNNFDEYRRFNLSQYNSSINIDDFSYFYSCLESLHVREFSFDIIYCNVNTNMRASEKSKSKNQFDSSHADTFTDTQQRDLEHRSIDNRFSRISAKFFENDSVYDEKIDSARLEEEKQTSWEIGICIDFVLRTIHQKNLWTNNLTINSSCKSTQLWKTFFFRNEEKGQENIANRSLKTVSFMELTISDVIKTSILGDFRCNFQHSDYDDKSLLKFLETLIAILNDFHVFEKDGDLLSEQLRKSGWTILMLSNTRQILDSFITMHTLSISKRSIDNDTTKKEILHGMSFTPKKNRSNPKDASSIVKENPTISAIFRASNYPNFTAPKFPRDHPLGNCTSKLAESYMQNGSLRFKRQSEDSRRRTEQIIDSKISSHISNRTVTMHTERTKPKFGNSSLDDVEANERREDKRTKRHDEFEETSEIGRAQYDDDSTINIYFKDIPIKKQSLENSKDGANETRAMENHDNEPNVRITVTSFEKNVSNDTGSKTSNEEATGDDLYDGLFDAIGLKSANVSIASTNIDERWKDLMNLNFVELLRRSNRVETRMRIVEKQLSDVNHYLGSKKQNDIGTIQTEAWVSPYYRDLSKNSVFSFSFQLPSNDDNDKSHIFRQNEDFWRLRLDSSQETAASRSGLNDRFGSFEQLSALNRKYDEGRSNRFDPDAVARSLYTGPPKTVFASEANAGNDVGRSSISRDYLEELISLLLNCQRKAIEEETMDAKSIRYHHPREDRKEFVRNAFKKSNDVDRDILIKSPSAFTTNDANDAGNFNIVDYLLLRLLNPMKELKLAVSPRRSSLTHDRYDTSSRKKLTETKDATKDADSKLLKNEGNQYETTKRRDSVDESDARAYIYALLSIMDSIRSKSEERSMRKDKCDKVERCKGETQPRPNQTNSRDNPSDKIDYEVTSVDSRSYDSPTKVTKNQEDLSSTKPSANEGVDDFVEVEDDFTIDESPSSDDLLRDDQASAWRSQNSSFYDDLYFDYIYDDVKEDKTSNEDATVDFVRSKSPDDAVKPVDNSAGLVLSDDNVRKPHDRMNARDDRQKSKGDEGDSYANIKEDSLTINRRTESPLFLFGSKDSKGYKVLVWPSNWEGYRREVREQRERLHS